MEDTLLRLSMIANVTDGRVKEAMLDDDEVRDIRKEAAFMGESKEVQLMLIQEKLAGLDCVTHAHDCEAKGKVKTLWALVRKGKLSLEDAIDEAGLTEEEFLNQVKYLEKEELVTA